MIKQLIVAANFLLIQDELKTIYYACAIFDFIILAQYLLYNDETLFYIEHTLYRLNKTKIAFENYYLINIKLFQPTFNYPKFYAITHFIQYIWDYDSTINYDIAYIETAHKYFLKVFYGKTIKKEYKS